MPDILLLDQHTRHILLMELMYRYPGAVFVMVEIFVGGLVGELEILETSITIMSYGFSHFNPLSCLLILFSAYQLWRLSG